MLKKLSSHPADFELVGYGCFLVILLNLLIYAYLSKSFYFYSYTMDIIIDKLELKKIQIHSQFLFCYIVRINKKLNTTKYLIIKTTKVLNDKSYG